MPYDCPNLRAAQPKVSVWYFSQAWRRQMRHHRSITGCLSNAGKLLMHYIIGQNIVAYFWQTFNFYVSRNKVDSLRGADPQQLEAKIKNWTESIGGGAGENGNATVVPGQVPTDNSRSQALQNSSQVFFRSTWHRFWWSRKWSAWMRLTIFRWLTV